MCSCHATAIQFESDIDENIISRESASLCFCKADHVPVVAGSDEIGPFFVRIHHSAEYEAAQTLDLSVGIGQVKQHPGIPLYDQDGIAFKKERKLNQDRRRDKARPHAAHAEDQRPKHRQENVQKAVLEAGDAGCHADVVDQHIVGSGERNHAAEREAQRYNRT